MSKVVSKRFAHELDSELENLAVEFLAVRFDEDARSRLPTPVEPVGVPYVFPYRRANASPSESTDYIPVISVCILLVIAALYLPIPFVTVGHGQARTASARADISAFESAIDAFEIDTKRLPTPSEGFSALVSQPANADGWSGPYIKKTPIDPWGSPYVYVFPGTRHHPNVKYDIFSSGPDGKPGTADDIGNW